MYGPAKLGGPGIVGAGSHCCRRRKRGFTLEPGNGLATTDRVIIGEGCRTTSRRHRGAPPCRAGKVSAASRRGAAAPIFPPGVHVHDVFLSLFLGDGCDGIKSPISSFVYFYTQETAREGQTGSPTPADREHRLNTSLAKITQPSCNMHALQGRGGEN